MHSPDPGDVLRRDFALVPLPPSNSWVPARQPAWRPTRTSRLFTSVVFVSALVLGVGIGLGIEQVRPRDAGPAAAATPTDVVLTRNDAESRARGLTGVVARVD